jgi:hypothetical protein
MINDILISEGYYWALYFGVDDTDSLVKRVTVVELNPGGSTALLRFFETGTQNVIYSHEFAAAEVVDLPEENYVPYSTRTATVPATGEEVTVMAGPDYQF